MSEIELSDKEKESASYYDTYAEEWASRRKQASEASFWHQELMELKQFRIPRGKILELGSGSGRESLELTDMGYEYVGIDSSRKLLQIAKKAHPVNTFLHATAYDLPFAENSFDAFFSWAMLPHIPKERIRLALQELQRVLKPDAIGFIAMREGEGELQELETGRWFSYYNQTEFEKILNINGFDVVKMGRRPSRVNLTWLTFFVCASKLS